MKILLKSELRGQFEEVVVEKGTTIEDICKKIGKSLPYRILAAKVDNKTEGLTHRPNRECKVELLDMRTQQANLIYQKSLCLLYLKAIEDVMGHVEVDIENSLNKGLYTEIKGPQAVSAKDIKNIQTRMWELVDADLPLVEESLSREEAIQQFEKTGCPEKEALLCADKRKKNFTFYSLDGYKDFFYGIMVPSTGYLKDFQLVKYKRGVLLRFPHPSKPDEIPEYVDEKMLYQTFGEQTRWASSWASTTFQI